MVEILTCVETKYNNIFKKYNLDSNNNLLLKITDLTSNILEDFIKTNTKKISYININLLPDINNFTLIINILLNILTLDCIVVINNTTLKNIEENKIFQDLVKEKNIDYDFMDEFGNVIYAYDIPFCYKETSILDNKELSIVENKCIIKISSVNLSYKYIFARFNEDVSWFSYDKNIMNNSIIYNKGNPLNLKNEIFLENVGRDPGTFFQFIIDYYEDLPDICIFSQGRLDDTYVYGKLGDINSLKQLKKDAIFNSMSPYVEIIGDKSWGNEWNLNYDWGHDASLYKNKKVIKCIDWVIDNVNSNVTNLTKFHTCCIFSVSKEKILFHSKEYYENLLEQVNWSNQCMEQTFVERSLVYIFNPIITN